MKVFNILNSEIFNFLTQVKLSEVKYHQMLICMQVYIIKYMYYGNNRINVYIYNIM